MSFNGGAGKVTDREHILIPDSAGLKLGSVKHANGRDWWVIGHEAFTKRFYKFLVTPEGIEGPSWQGIGSVTGNPINAEPPRGEIVFSGDGTKVAVSGFSGLLNLFDFDRCSGMLSNFIDLGDIDSAGNTTTYEGFDGIEFSPSGRFLYSTGNELKTRM